MRELVTSIEGEFRRYRAIGESALAQLDDDALCAAEPGAGNSAATIVWHVAGNFASRFSDFLTTDGEKPWRDRDAEFEPRRVARAELMAHWERGWTVLIDSLASLTDADLERTVTIRRQPLMVHEALHRSLAHAAYHVGQLVHIGKTRGPGWKYLSIPPGESAAYNRAPAHESARAHADKIKRP